MKKIVLIAVLLVMICGCSYSQSYTVLDKSKLLVQYELTFKEDSTHLDYVNHEKQMLLVGNTVSSYQSYNRYRLMFDYRKAKEEGSFDVWRLGGGITPEAYGARYSYVIFKNYPKGKMTVTENVFMVGPFVYEEELNPFDWQILDDTMLVDGYRSQKAVCNFGGRTWEAWFTDDLPFEDGPWKFSGLPGLILKVSDTRGHYSFEMLSIEVPNENMKIELEDKDRMRTTKKGFFKAEDLGRATIQDNMEGAGNSQEMSKTAGAIAASRNNPIELDRK